MICGYIKKINTFVKKSVMKSKLFISIFLLICSISVRAQHLIVTTDNDTLNCKIESFKDDQYKITFMMNREEVNAFIHKDKVLYLEKNVFKNYDNNEFRPWYPTFDVSFYGGVTHHVGLFQIYDDLTDKSNFAARTGFGLGTDLTFFVSERIGYGIKYNYRSLLGGDIYYQYIGPMMVFRFWEHSKMNSYRYRNVNKTNHFFFSFSAGLGWMRQQNAPIQLELIRPRITMSARAVSGEIGAGYNIRFSHKVSTCIKASFNFGYPTFIKIHDIQKYALPASPALDIGDYCNNMNTLNLSVGFTFHN